MDKAGETLEHEGTRKVGGSLADFSQRGGAGVTNGVGEGRFAPDETCTRAQIVTFLWRSYNG